LLDQGSRAAAVGAAPWRRCGHKRHTAVQTCARGGRPEAPIFAWAPRRASGRLTGVSL